MLAIATSGSRRPGRHMPGLLALGALLLAAGMMTTRPARRQPAPRPPPTRFTVGLAPNRPLGPLTSPCIAVAPDGSSFVYTLMGSELFLRRMDEFEARLLLGTADASCPFFSPDGNWIGFFSEGKLKKVSLVSGEVGTLCNAPVGRGGSWGSDGTIVYASSFDSALWKVPAHGGAPRAVTNLDSASGEITHRWPEVLPGGNAVLFTVQTRGKSSFDEANIAVADLRSGKHRVLLAGGTNPHYAPTGHLLFVRGLSLYAVAFDMSRLEVTGDAVVVVDHVFMNPTMGAAQMALSASGALVYAEASSDSTGYGLLWVDRNGLAHPIGELRGAFENPRLSSDGTHLTYVALRKHRRIATYELQNATVTLLTSGTDEGTQPVWSPDGQWIAYSASRGGPWSLFRRRSDGSGSEELLHRGDHDLAPCSWSPDGQFLAYTENNPETGYDVWILPLRDGGRAYPLLRTKFNEDGARFSLDGRWMAYACNETGRPEVYLQPFPGFDGRQLVSSGGGYSPAWSSNGREIFYRNGEQMMLVEIETEPLFTAGAPTPLFDGPYTGDFDVMFTAQLFVMANALVEAWPSRLDIVLDWFGELESITAPRDVR